MLAPAEVAAIERATIAAVAPAQVHELDGWLVPVDAGTIGRAKAAVPLRHDVPLVVGLIDQVEALYRAAGVAPAFRLADDPRLQPVADELARRGYRPEQPTLVKTGDPAGLIALGATAAGLAAAPDASWAQAFAGDGFDPADAAHRLRNFRRSPDAVFASVREHGQALAVGVAAFAHGWASVHGMRTQPSRRGEGLAGRVLVALAQAAAERGVTRIFLQVEEPNTAARALYRRAGLQPAWRYFYWRWGPWPEPRAATSGSPAQALPSPGALGRRTDDEGGQDP